MTRRELFHLIAVLALWALAMTWDYNEQTIEAPPPAVVTGDPSHGT